MEPECLRLKGELLLAGENPDRAAAEAVLRESLQLAKAQKAKSWELRSAASLATLWQSSAREAEAVDVLAPIHDWFTEGLDTPDLRRAKDLLLALQ